MLDFIASALALLELLRHWRFCLCFAASGGAAIGLLFTLSRPWGIAFGVAILVVGIALGIRWQRRHERELQGVDGQRG